MDAILKASLPKLREKLLEALQAVLPIVAIVLVLCFTIAPVSPSILLCFLLGAVLIVVGIMFFTLGAEMSMTPMGERVGAVLTRSRKLPVILGVGFLLGFLITISEPDLQVLANQVPSIPNRTLIFSVAAGVGLFLTVAFLRMLLGVALPPLLVAFYGLVFVLAAFVPREFLAVAFDSGGVTTGPMTVPFIAGRGRVGDPRRPPCGGRQLWSGGTVLSGPHSGGADPRHRISRVRQHLHPAGAAGGERFGGAVAAVP